MAVVKEDKHTCLIQEHGSVAGRAAGVAKVERGEDLLAPDDHNEAEDNGNTQHEPVVSAGLVAQQLWRGKEGSKVTKMDLVKGDVNAKAKASNKNNVKPVEDEGTVQQPATVQADHDDNKCPADGYKATSENQCNSMNLREIITGLNSHELHTRKGSDQFKLLKENLCS